MGVHMTQVHIGHMKVRKVGTSLVVTIPKPAAEALGISEGDILDVSVEPMERGHAETAPGRRRARRLSRKSGPASTTSKTGNG